MRSFGLVLDCILNFKFGFQSAMQVLIVIAFILLGSDQIMHFYTIVHEIKLRLLKFAIRWKHGRITCNLYEHLAYSVQHTVW